jgi:hypothetical protein
VVRRIRFQRDHPEVTFVPPGTLLDSWRAIVSPGTIPGDPTATTLGSYELAGLMDQLDSLFTDLDPDRSRPDLCRPLRMGRPDAGTRPRI